MLHRYIIEAIDRSLRDILYEPEIPFGDKVVLLSGDPKQLLPIIQNADRVTIISAILKNSCIWQHITPF